MMMDDYYELLGVDATATTDDIRAAYRERKAALETMSGGTSKSDAAKLNKAWNVLSDPYQRGRYDQQLADSGEVDDDDLDDDEEVSTNGRASARAARATRAERPARQGRQMPPPTITPPEGTRWPLPKQRIIAMVIDLLILLVLIVGAQFAGDRLAKSQHPQVYAAAHTLRNDTIPADDKVTKQAKSALDQANKGTDQTAKTNANNTYQALKTTEDNDKKQLDDYDRTLAPSLQIANAVAFALAFLYLFIPSALTGRTLGKRTQHLKVLEQDGSKLRPFTAVKRYGLLVLLTYALSFLLGPLAAVIVLVGVTTWMRNPNFQGMHDRISHTIVVNDAT